MDPTTSAAILFLTIMMAGNAPDIKITRPQSSIEECWKEAHDFVAHTLPQYLVDNGAVGLAAGCAAKQGEAL